MGLVRGYLATSLDGFIAGPHDEIAWLQEPRLSGLPLASGAWAARGADGLEFEDFLAGVGCIVMGRRTYEVVREMPGPWAYGDIPMLIVTSRPLDGAPPQVSRYDAGVEQAIERAEAVAGGRDVYVDGGQTVRAALDGGLLDHLVITVLPTALGRGVPLLAGLRDRVDFTVTEVRRWGPGLVQLHLTTRAGAV